MDKLNKITTEYIITEDRIRICGETINGQTITIWLTHRLLNALLPHLFAWLDKNKPIETVANIQSAPVKQIVQEFAQEAAVSKITQQEPVKPKLETRNLLPQAIDISFNEKVLTLIFRALEHDRNSESYSFSMEALILRQWLHVLFQHYKTARWTMETWPEWITQSKTSFDKQLAQ